MSKKEVQRAEIRRSRIKGKVFVRYVGDNGEPLAPSETVSHRQNAHKNIAAIVRLGHGTYMNVLNLAGKSVEAYTISSSGKRVNVTRGKNREYNFPDAKN